jgi:hypothetical protein
MKAVVLLELNEVPNAVLDAYARRSPFMAEFLDRSARYETIAADRTQLDPWIAWPSLHRGVNDQVHGILHLGHTPKDDTSHPPIWRILADRGVKVGVYGSLHAGLETDVDRYAFFVPDVFSPEAEVKPRSLRRFHDFNLAMTRASARNASDSVSPAGALSIVEMAARRRISVSTLWRLATQVAAERLDRKRVSRRRNTQAELHGDVFCSLMEETRPQFATFFTNNVAAAQHRFWSASMRESSINADRLDEAWLADYADEVFVALGSIERMLRRLTRGPLGQELTIVIAGAIGQEEIPAENHQRFLTVVDPGAFFAAVVGEARAPKVEQRPTMVPDFTFRFEDAAALDRVQSGLREFRINGYGAVETERRVRDVALIGDDRLAHIRHSYAEDRSHKHPISFCRSDANTLHLSLQIDDHADHEEAVFGNRRLAFSDCGLGSVNHDEGVNCTAHHSPRGALVVHGGHARPAGEVTLVSALDVAPSLLAHHGVEPAAYMMGSQSVRL